MSKICPDDPDLVVAKRYRLKKTVALVGMMGAGKTAVGKALAERLGVPFLDSDQEIEEASMLSIAEIFERHGEAFFRQKETQILSRLLDGEACILSTGGGAFLAPQNQQILSDKGISVCLQADIDLLWSRVKHKSTRPLLQTDDPYATLTQIYNARAHIYEMADLCIQAHSDYAIGDMVSKTLAALQSYPDILEVM